MSITAPPDFTRTAYVVADSTGRIILTGLIPAVMIQHQQTPEGGAIVLGDGGFDTDWVSDGVITPRPQNTATLSGMSLTKLPTPCTITVESVTHDCADDHCDLSFSQPGTYTVTVSAFPMLDATFEVTQV